MFEVVLTKLTHEMEAAVIVEWLKAEGDSVEKGEPIARVETDKATVELEADASGTLAGVCVAAGEEVPVGTRLAYLLGEGETVPAGSTDRVPTPRTPDRTTPERTTPDESPPGSSPDAPAHVRAGAGAHPTGDRLVATPIARRLAREHGVDLTSLSGSGPAGRIVEKDVLARLEEARVPPAAGDYQVVALTTIQRKTGQRLLESVRQAPYFDLEAEIDMSGAIERRAAGSGFSFTALLIHAVARALADVPRLNAHFVADELRVYDNVNVGVAMAIDAGLVVPVVHGAQKKSVEEIDAVLGELKAKGREKRLTLEDLSGATFTLTNLGTHGVDRFRAILNPPEVGILAVGRIADRAVAHQGQVVVRPVAAFTLTVDHRALDGAVAAPFLQRLRAGL